VPHLTRRHTLKLGVAAAVTAVTRPASALAGEPALFEMALPDGRNAYAASGWRTTGVLEAPRRFDLIGLRWRGKANLHAQVRARRRKGSWSRWVDLPHPHAPLSGTDPAWTGPCDLFQLRLRGSARDLRARFVRVGRHRARIAARRRAAQQAPGGPPPIITRQEWGADQVPPRSAPEYGEVHLGFVHHTAGTNNYNPEDSAGIVLGIARYHRNSNGWNDIGYNFLVDKYGQIFEGRGGGIDQPVMGAQAEGWNSMSTGIACLGNYESVLQSEAGMDALARLLGWKLSLHGVPVQGEVTLTSTGGGTNRYPRGTAVTFQRISGHRDGNSTACPGTLLYGQLEDLRARAARYAGPISSLTITAPSTEVKPGAGLALSGALRFSDGSSPAGVPVRIEFQAAGSAWQPFATVSAAADGSWSASLQLPQSGYVRAVFDGDASRPPLISKTVAVTVATKVKWKVTPRKLRRGRYVTVTGTVDPVPANKRIEVRLENVARRSVSRRRVAVSSSGRFKKRLKVKGRGRYRVWVVAPGAYRSRVIRSR
jgi:hypothetical protein